jgi:virginiamycin B lyase
MMSRTALNGKGFVMAALAAAILLAGCKVKAGDPAGNPAAVAEFAIDYAKQGRAIDLGGKCAVATASMAHSASTHEIEPHGDMFWVSGQNHDALVRVKPDGDEAPAMDLLKLPERSGPHGIAVDSAGLLWVTLEYRGCVVALDGDRVVAAHDVTLECTACAREAGAPPVRINSNPHGLGVGPDGRTIWFTGKANGTVGRIGADGTLSVFALPTAGSTPIYIKAGPDHNMWVTELTGNRIARVTLEGEVTEFPIPTPYSRPIAIVPGPDGTMWFSEEAGSNVARIDKNGKITEFAVPKAQPNHILAGLAFDREGNLWVQQYVDHNRPSPAGADRIVRIAKAGLVGAADGLTDAHFTFYPVPTRDTVMHRIVEGPDRALWFTEMNADKIGRLAPSDARR